jgi:hypothetical protein
LAAPAASSVAERQHDASPSSAAAYRFVLLPDPEQLYGYDRVAVLRGSDIRQTLSLAQDRWLQDAEQLKRSRFSLFDVDRDGYEDVVLWSEQTAVSFVTVWRFNPAEKQFWPHPSVYHVRERVAAKAGGSLSASLLMEEPEADSSGKPEQPLSVPILVHREDRIVDFIENDELVEFDGVATDRPFVDVNFDGHDDLMLSRAPCSGNCYFAFWMFDPKSKRFGKHDGLSELASPDVDARAKEIRSFHSHGLAGALHTYARYRFVGREIEKVWESEQADDVRAPGSLGGPFDGVFHRTVRARHQGKMEVLCEGFVRYAKDEVLALTRGDRAACKY